MRPILYLANVPFVPVPQRTARMNIVMTASLAAFIYLGIAGVIGASHLVGNHDAPGKPAIVAVALR
jgi:hypothetical protein